MRHLRLFIIFSVLAIALLPQGQGTAAPAEKDVTSPQAASAAARQAVVALVAEVRHADYAGDRAALGRLHGELAPYVQDQALASRVQYWRGFALWRKSLNGFNESADGKEIEADLTQAIADFRDAQVRAPGFVDAQAGEASCLANLAFLKRGSDSPRARELLLQSVGLLSWASSAAPENPRVLWVLGANQWYSPSAVGGGQSRAYASYERALELAREQKGRVTDPLEPAWGEPELLMNLGFANLNQKTPDLAAAERYARDALAQVPHWHYVRDILIPQIEKAKASTQASSPTE